MIDILKRLTLPASRVGISVVMMSSLSLFLGVALGPSSAKAAPPPGIPNGKFIDVVGGEDFYIIIKNSIVVDFDGCLGNARRGCATAIPEVIISAFNPSTQAITINVPTWKLHQLTLCPQQTAPQNVDWRSGEQYRCDFQRGWVKQ